MPNGYGPKEYGGHKYAEHDGTSDCEHGCGCWMGPARSGGPVGLNPGGRCPKNPKNGELLGGNADYEYIVEERIRSLESRVYEAEELLKKVSPNKKGLAKKLSATRRELVRMDILLKEIHDKSSEEQTAEQKSLREGFPPRNQSCDHKHWDFKKHGRHCTCGAMMEDFGD